MSSVSVCVRCVSHWSVIDVKIIMSHVLSSVAILQSFFVTVTMISVFWYNLWPDDLFSSISWTSIPEESECGRCECWKSERKTFSSSQDDSSLILLKNERSEEKMHEWSRGEKERWVFFNFLKHGEWRMKMLREGHLAIQHGVSSSIVDWIIITKYTTEILDALSFEVDCELEKVCEFLHAAHECASCFIERVTVKKHHRDLTKYQVSLIVSGNWMSCEY